VFLFYSLYKVEHWNYLVWDAFLVRIFFVVEESEAVLYMRQCVYRLLMSVVLNGYHLLSNRYLFSFFVANL